MANTALVTETRTYDERQARLKLAFGTVEPKEHWKAAIDAVVERATLEALGLSIADVREAVIHFTATVPVIHPWVSVDEEDTRHVCYRVSAAGYWAGPAGGGV